MHEGENNLHIMPDRLSQIGILVNQLHKTNEKFFELFKISCPKAKFIDVMAVQMC